MTYSQLRKDLLAKLGITRRALNQQCQNLKSQTPMTTEEALYVIAQRRGMALDRYPDTETLNNVRGLLQQLARSEQTAIRTTAGKAKGSSSPKQKIIRIGKALQYTDPILSTRKIAEAADMAEVYPLIYVLENSIREFIHRVMTAEYGDGWWDSQAPSKLRDRVSARRADDERNSWHQRRGARPIDYVDLSELPHLMNKIQTRVVPDIIPSLEWFRQFVVEVYKSRCVVCHMNPLYKTNIQSVEVKFKQWQNQISDKKHLIPGQSP